MKFLRKKLYILTKLSEIVESVRSKNAGPFWLTIDIFCASVLKFSLPRPYTQGSLNDRDMHGATWAALINDIEL